jgi:hypothetical protein
VARSRSQSSRLWYFTREALLPRSQLQLICDPVAPGLQIPDTVVPMRDQLEDSKFPLHASAVPRYEDTARRLGSLGM